MSELERDINRLAREMMADDEKLTDEATHALARVVILDLLRQASREDRPGAKKHFKPTTTA